MRKTRGLGIMTAAVALTLAVAAPAQAGTFTGTWPDETHDVHITKKAGLGDRARQSIDIKEVRIIDGDTTTRFSVTVRRLVRGAHYLQGIGVSWVKSDGTHDMGLQFYAQDPSASWAAQGDRSGEGSVFCKHLRTVRMWDRNKIFVDVPHRCVPQDLGRVHVKSGTLPASTPVIFGRDLYSVDRLTFRSRLR